MSLYAAIEGGGTWFRCALGRADGTAAGGPHPHQRRGHDLEAVVQFFRPWLVVQRAGFGCFGPLQLSKGLMGKTPKPGWSDADLRGVLEGGLRCEVQLDTDVNAAALGEWVWGPHHMLRSLLYVTVGTGIGGGLIHRGRPLTGERHPEMGHIRVPRLEGDRFPGTCPFHGDCLEGLASGPAIAARAGRSAKDLPLEDPHWTPVIEALAQGVCSWWLTMAPDRIVMGGGVMKRHGLLPRVGERVKELLAGYQDFVPERDLCLPSLGGRSGVLGSLALACQSDEGEVAQP